jgi:hypothetical protein
MHLVHCATPQEPLEDAPRSALLADLTDGEQWDGFWSSLSDAYYVRCTRHTGVTEWFQLADEVASTAAATPAEPRVLPFRRARNQSRVEFVIARSPNGQRMLVGSARRTPR